MRRFFLACFAFVMSSVTVARCCPSAQDVGMASLDFGLAANTTFTPKATVKNYGAVTSTFTVTMTIGSYSSTKTVTALAPGLTRQVTFDICNLNYGDYTVNVCTQLAPDINPSNDCIISTVKILNLYNQAYA